MTRNNYVAALLAVLVLVAGFAPPTFSQSAAKAVFAPTADLEWTSAGPPGVHTAPVKGKAHSSPLAVRGERLSAATLSQSRDRNLVRIVQVFKC